MAVREELDLSDNSLRKAIIEFVKKNPECLKETVVSHCIESGQGSRVPIFKAIQELIDEGIINPGKKRDNSKSYKLTINSENLLLTIPQDLEHVLQKFNTFVDKVKEKEQKGISINYNHTHSGQKDIRFYKNIKNIVPLLPYDLIEIINDLYTFFFIVILPKKLHNRDNIKKLHSYYLENLSKMYYYIVKDSKSEFEPFDLLAIRKSDLYNSYINSKGLSVFSKVYELARVCRAIDMEDYLYDVLDILWIKNEDSSSLLYNLETFSNADDVYILKKDVPFRYSSEVLNKIHFQIEFYIHLLEISNIEDLTFSN